MKNSGNSHKAFTLIELLVVITIISILMSMLFVVVGMARNAGEKVACLSALRQLGLGMVAYSMDNRGFIPRMNDETTPMRGGSWSAGLAPYTETSMSEVDSVDKKANLLRGCKAMWKCAGGQAIRAAGNNFDRIDAGIGYCYQNYPRGRSIINGKNSTYLDPSLNFGSYPNGDGVYIPNAWEKCYDMRLSSITYRDRRAAFYDADTRSEDMHCAAGFSRSGEFEYFFGSFMKVPAVQLGGENAYPHNRHGSVNNYAMYDGSARSLMWSIDGANAYYGNDAQLAAAAP